MAEIPKIVVQRLQANAGAGDHPDPNVISAFLEKSLGPRERDKVLGHVAQCAACREVISLSLPEQTDAFAGEVIPARSGWLSGAVLRWSAVAACVVVVGAAVGLHYWETNSRFSAETQTSALRYEARTAAPAPQSDSGQVTAKDIAPSVEARRHATFNPAAAARAKQPESGTLGGGLALDKSASMDKKALGAVEKSAEPAKADAAKPGTVEVGVAAIPSANSPAQNEASEAVPGRAKDALQESEGAKSNVDLAGAALMKQSASAPVPMAKKRVAMVPAVRFIPRWTLNSDGALLRSLDSGSTWKTIFVPGQPSLRALSAHGMVIWVGGANGALYHSQDAGETWKQVQPTVNGEALSGDIIGVEFLDPQGTVTTSRNETWTTADQGQTWQKK